MDIVAFIHAKGNSERVPSKNKRLLGDSPLFTYAIENALNSDAVTKVVIDSDDDEILNIGASLGAEILKRPVEMATNKTTGDDLMFWQASNYPSADIVLQVVPTAPFLSPSSIDGAIELLNASGTDSVTGCFKEAFYTWTNDSPSYYVDGRIPNSFELTPVVYETTGLYVNRTSFVLKSKKRLNPENCKPYFLTKIETIDINSVEDFYMAELILKGLTGN